MFYVLLFLSIGLNAAGVDSRTYSSPGVRTAAATSFKSYKDWKNEQVLYWRSRGQVEMAQDLTVADYFAGYLMKQKDQAQAIKEVSRRMSADEVAELMTIYAHSVFGTRPPQLPTQADNLEKDLRK